MSKARVDTLSTLDDSSSVGVNTLTQLPSRVTANETSITKLQNSLALTTLASANNFALVEDQSFIITGSYSVYLPFTAGLRVGATIELQKVLGSTPTIYAKVGDLIKFANGTTDSAATYDIDSKLKIVWNGTTWEIFKCQQA